MTSESGFADGDLISGSGGFGNSLATENQCGWNLVALEIGPRDPNEQMYSKVICDVTSLSGLRVSYKI